MSYDIYLREPVTKNVIEFEAVHDMTGGTYALGGTREAWLNITYNYSRWYYLDGVFPSFDDTRFPAHMGGIRSIYGLSGAESIPVIEKAIEALWATDAELTEKEIKEFESQGATGYWLPTKENAIKPLYKLLAMAKMRPDGVWDGD